LGRHREPACLRHRQGDLDGLVARHVSGRGRE
jgi:hypothetical protein